MVEQFTDLSVSKFRDNKQSLQFNLKGANDTRSEKSATARWVGFGFGILIILFVFMFGMTMSRSVAREKWNIIVEVLLSSVIARQLLTGKVLEIGFSALIQFTAWVVIIGFGLYVFRLTLFPDMLCAGFVADEMAKEGAQNPLSNQSPFVELIYSQIHYTNMLIFFTLFFLGGYLFYGSF